MTDLQHESTFIHFLRAGVLLAALIVVPGTAVCWNMIPKDIFLQDDDSSETLRERNSHEESGLRESENKKMTLNGTDRPEATPVSLMSVSEPALRPSTTENASVRRMAGREDDTRESRIPRDFSGGNNVWATYEDRPNPKIASRPSLEESAQRSFPSLENRLKQLGAKYYRLEKWGSRGELYRFSCYVSSPAPHQYRKHFQAIDSDELHVMETVIRDIELWKSGKSTTNLEPEAVAHRP